MPWHIENDNPECSGFAVVKDADGSVAGCHKTEEDAKAQLAALYANEEAAMPDEKTAESRIEIRAASSAPTFEDGTGRPRIAGHFARFNVFNEIEGTDGPFLERIEPGAFRKTFRESGKRIRMLFQHGRDPHLGDKPIGAPDVLREDDIGPYFEGDLFESVPPLIVDGLRAGQYGISYRFQVMPDKDLWVYRPEKSDVNPRGIPERTIREARVFEFGPVTFPADMGADYAVRAITLPDLDAAAQPPEQTEALPADGAAAEPHSDEGSRETVVVTIEPALPPKEKNVPDEPFTIEEKRARDREITDELTRIVNDYTGVLPTEEQARWDNLTAEQDRLRADIAADESRRARLQQAAEDGKDKPIYQPPQVSVVKRLTETDIYDPRAVEAPTMELRLLKTRDLAMRAAEQLRVTGDRYDQAKSRERLQDLIDSVDSEDKEIARRVLATNSPAYRAAFNRYVKTGGQERGTALAVGVDATGGYAVPVSFDPSVVAIGAHTAINPYRQSCRIVTIAGTDTWQALTSTAIVAAYATEAAAATEQGPTFARPEFIAKRAHAFVTASYEMMQDRPDLAAELGVLFGEAKDNLEENQFTVGTGATVYPQGIGFKDAFTRTDSITNDVHAVGDVLALEAALPIRHRLNAAWYLSRAAIRAIQAYETVGGQLFSGVGYPAVGNPIGRVVGNTGLTLLGYPIWETPSMPWTPTVDDTTWGVLMDPRNYVILDRVGMSIRVIPDMLNGATPSVPTGEVGIYAFWRGTARVLNADGGRQGAIQ